MFQDDFETLGDKDERGGSKSILTNTDPLPFSDIDYSKNKSVSSIAFHPTKSHILALSFRENLNFDERAEISGKSFMSSVPVLNYADSTIITKQAILETPIEVEQVMFHPERPDTLIGGTITGQLTFWDFQDETTRSGEK